MDASHRELVGSQIRAGGGAASDDARWVVVVQDLLGGVLGMLGDLGVALIMERPEPLDLPDATPFPIFGNEASALADPGRVRQILRNLTTNALRHGGDNIEVVVSTDSDSALVEICDDGARLPEVEWERIFDPYYRYHAEASQPGSVGLGLTVARGLAELMNRTLTYRHHNGRSIFALRLPQSNGRSDHTSSRSDRPHRQDKS